MQHGAGVWYGDESYDHDAGKSDYVVGLVRPLGEPEGARNTLRDLVRRPRSDLHFYDERERRLELTQAVLAMPLELLLVVRSGPGQVARARALCLRAAVWDLRDRADGLVLESRGEHDDAVDARQLRRTHPAECRLPVRFLGKDGDPLLWAADIIAGAGLQAAVRGIADFADLLRDVRRVDC